MKRSILPPIDFKAYRRSRYLLAVYEEFGRGALPHGARYKREECPICMGPDVRGRCFSWSFERGAFYCHKCKAKGDTVELVRVLMRCSVVQAAKWLETRGGPSGSGVVLADSGS